MRKHKVRESKEALAIDDSKERKELAKIAGLKRVPRRTGEIMDIVGLFDDLVSPGEKVDAVEMVRKIRGK